MFGSTNSLLRTDAEIVERALPPVLSADEGVCVVCVCVCVCVCCVCVCGAVWRSNARCLSCTPQMRVCVCVCVCVYVCVRLCVFCTCTCAYLSVFSPLLSSFSSLSPSLCLTSTLT